MAQKVAALFTVRATGLGPPTFEEAARLLHINLADIDREFSPALIDPKAELYCVRAFVDEDEMGFPDVQIQPLVKRED